MVEGYFGLRPCDHLPVRRIALHSAAQPCGVSVPVCHRRTVRMLSDEAPSVVVKPVQVLAVRGPPSEVGGTRMLHQPSVGESLVIRRVPGPAAVAAVCVHGMSVDRAVDAVQGPVAEHRIALLAGNRTPAGGRPQPDVTLRESLPTDPLGIRLGKDVVATQQHALVGSEEALSETSHLCQRHVSGAGVSECLANIPEEADAALVGVVPIDVELANGNRMAIARPRSSSVVAVLEHEVPETVDPSAPSVRIGGPVRLDLPDVVGVVVVENVNPAARNLQHHGVGCFRAVRRLHRNGLAPSAAAVPTEERHHMLALLALAA